MEEVIKGGVEIKKVPANSGGSREELFHITLGNYMTPKVVLMLNRDEIRDLKEAINQITE